MAEKNVTVNLKTGLHARPAALFVQEANKYSSEVFVSKNNKKVNAKSIMGIMSLAVAHGSEITISARGFRCGASDRGFGRHCQQGGSVRIDPDNHIISAGPLREDRRFVLVWSLSLSVKVLAFLIL